MTDNKTVEFEVSILRKSDDAYLMDIDGKELWVPKSVVTCEETYDTTNEMQIGKGYGVEIQEWFCHERGLI